MNTEPKNPYRKWVAEIWEAKSTQQYWDLVAIEPDGIRLVMRTAIDRHEAEATARLYTEVERRAQLAREENPV